MTNEPPSCQACATAPAVIAYTDDYGETWDVCRACADAWENDE